MTINKFLSCCLLLLLFLSCKEKDRPADNLFQFKDYINYTSSGRLSVTDHIEIGLTEPIEGWEEDKELDASLISISPGIKGEVKAISSRQFAFYPEEDLSPDTEYTVSVALENLYDGTGDEFSSYTFKFKTIQPNFSLSTTGLQSYSKDWQYLDGSLRLADQTSLDDVKKLVEAAQDGKDLKIKWEGQSEKSRFFTFKIDSIKRSIEDSEVSISWNGKPIKSDNKGKRSINIPGQNDFKVVGVSIHREPEQHIRVNFSDRLNDQQNFTGLVNLGADNTLTFTVDGNVLNVHSSNSLSGSMNLEVFQGIENNLGFKLKESYYELISFEPLKPAIRSLSGSGILPNSNDLKFNFEAVNLSAVDVRIIKVFEDNILQFLQENQLNSDARYSIKRVGRRIAKETIKLNNGQNLYPDQWKAYSLDLSDYFQADPGAIYRLEISFNPEYSLYECEGSELDAEDDEALLALSESREDLSEEAYWDNITYNYRRYYYNWRERDNPCHPAYYHEDRIVSANLVATNLGVIAKRGTNNSYYFAVNDILTTDPVSGARVTIFNYQQQPVANAITDEEGMTIIDSDKQAYFAIVEKGKQMSYLKLNDGQALSLSKFDISGKTLNRGLKGYIFGERGVWRPGDSLHLAFILEDKANPLPKGHPIKFELTDPSGRLKERRVTTVTQSGFHRFSIPTSTEDQTGNWNARISLGGVDFSKTLKIETIKPNRLKIDLKFEDEVLSASKEAVANLQVNWLHGAVAKNAKAEIKAKFSTADAGFQNYPGYVFQDPSREFNTEEVTIYDGKVGQNGKREIKPNLNIGTNAPGMLSVSFLTRAFEGGGDFSLDVFTKKYAPYESFVGIKSPEYSGYRSYYTDENHSFKVAVVDKDGKAVQREKLELRVYKIEWRWWWSSSYDNLSSYQSDSYKIPFKSETLATNAQGEVSFNLNIPDEESGRYLIRVFDPQSKHATGLTTYFYKDWWGGQEDINKEAASMLIFNSNKNNFNVGETAKITIPSSEGGRALISIENGTEVLNRTWVKTSEKQTEVNIPISSEMTPNVFINVSLLQPHQVTSNDLPIRLYGVIPIMVEDPSTRLSPEIKMPDVLRPEENYEIKVSEANNKEMTYTIAVVDEGLLDLTRFKTPNAWEAFYSREALGVKTWDLYDDVIGAYSGGINQVFEIGGDGSAESGKKNKANRFKPVVTYLGPFDLQAGETRSHQVKMPKYVGSVRTMVIAANKNKSAYGSTEKTTAVKNPLMVLATLPRKLSPGEKLILPVTVFAMEQKIKSPSISLSLPDGITIIGSDVQTLKFDQPDEKMAYFELQVEDVIQSGEITVNAKGHGEIASHSVEIDIFNPNPFSTEAESFSLDPGEELLMEVNTFGVSGTNSAQLELSSVPDINFSGRLDYLIRYPHGCVEQTTSGIFPQLFLNEIFNLTSSEQKEIDTNIKAAIRRLGNFQRPHGGLSYWMGENNVNDWGTSYAGHFMLEAERSGYVLPLTFRSNWVRYQKEAARSWRSGSTRYQSDLAQAYRLYTLALAGEPDLGAMNRLKEYRDISNDAKWRLAAAYALAGQEEAARDLTSRSNLNFESDRYDYYTYGSEHRNRALALETMVLLDDDRMVELSQDLAKTLSSDRWLSTQSTAYSLLSMAKLIRSIGGKELDFSFELNKEGSESVKSSKPLHSSILNISEGKNSLFIKNNGGNKIFAKVIRKGKLKLGQELSESRGLEIKSYFQTEDGKSVAINKLNQGQDFIMTIEVINKRNIPINEIALTQIVPSGWEIVNTRFTDYGAATGNQARYTDIRDDRVHYYFDLGSKGSKSGLKTFKLRLNASYLGRYYLPGTQAEAMYDNDFFVRSQGKWIEVIQAN